MADMIGALQQGALASLFNLWTSRVGEDLSKMVNKVVAISGGTWNVTEISELKQSYPMPRLIATIEMESHEVVYLLLSASDISVMVDLFMGGDGTGALPELNELQMNIVEETMNQLAASLSLILNQFTGKTYRPLPPKIQFNGLNFLPPQLVSLTYQMTIKEAALGPFIVLMQVSQAVELGTSLVNLQSPSPGQQPESPRQSPIQQPLVHGRISMPHPEPTPSLTEHYPAQQTLIQQPATQQNPTQQSFVETQDMREVLAKQVQLQQLTPQPPAQKVGNLNLIFDVLLQLTAVIGRTGITIRDLVELGPGSVLELDKLVGEAVELYANNKLVAKGEVVVIDERFGVRITETVTPVERLQGLKG